MRELLWGGPIAMALLLSSCTPSDPAAAPQESFAPQFVRFSTGQLDSAEEKEVRATIFHEVQNALADCMSAEGFEYTPEADLYKFESPAFSFFTEEDVRAHGFGIVAGWRAYNSDVALSISDNDRYIDGLDDQNRRAFFEALEGVEVGPSPSGCLGTAQDAAYDRLGIADLADALPTAIGQGSDDPRLVAADAKWRSCIRDLGIQTEVATLPDFIAELDDQFADGPATSGDIGEVEEFEQREKQLAEQTLECNVTRNDVLGDVISSALASEVAAS